ncbi:MAG: peroxiredoxin Q/BCP [Flavobacterium sp.]|jgi:peroxiredoxin Q/BCP
MLRIGDIAPEFELEDQSGNMINLSQLTDVGDLILYFYPADFSPVCTAEACAFRDSYEGIADIGTQIIGISPQSVSSHRRFSNTFSIPFPLLSDQRKRVIRAYGVDGPLGFGVRRATYLIDSKRVIQNRVVSDFLVNSHLDLIKETLRGGQSA